MDRLDAMQVFVTVVDAGSLSAAARQLEQPLATVSRKVAELESYLGVQLLQRSTRHVALTEAGRSYVEACRRILPTSWECPERRPTGTTNQTRYARLCGARGMKVTSRGLPQSSTFQTVHTQASWPSGHLISQDTS
jgi:DNA-binding transcriptional LysR family regulator